MSDIHVVLPVVNILKCRMKACGVVVGFALRFPSPFTINQVLKLAVTVLYHSEYGKNFLQ